MGKKKKQRELQLHEATLRAKGWMTTNEFLGKLYPSITRYIANTSYVRDDQLHHPEDLMVNVLTYVETLMHCIEDFGVEGEINAAVVNEIQTGGEKYKGDAYCVKCKEKTTFVGEIITSDSGRRMAKGNCPKCGTPVNRILGKVEL